MSACPAWPCLTCEEVRALPLGARILVRWPGALETRSYIVGSDEECRTSATHLRTVDLDPVGRRSNDTRVWLPQ